MNEDAVICDLAQVYGIFSYNEHSCRLIATLVSGLGENSRIAREECGISVSQEMLMLAHIADRLGAIIALLTQSEMPESLFENLTGTKKKKEKKEYISYYSPEDFIRERYGG